MSSATQQVQTKPTGKSLINGRARSLAGESSRGRLRAYIAIARPDHWIKNVFALFGTGAALIVHREYIGWSFLAPLLLGMAALCIVASSNYVINELLDAETDRKHPEKRFRPIP